MKMVTGDPPLVRNHDEEILRRFLTAKRAGDLAEARRYWRELFTLNFDRINNMVIAYSRRHLSPDEQQEAFQRVLIGIDEKLFLTFKGGSMGEWINAVKRLITFRCGDVKDDAVHYAKHTSPLHAEGEDDDRADRYDRDVFKAIEKRRQEDESFGEEVELLAERQDFLDWAVLQLQGKRAEVFKLDRQGRSVEEIQRELGMTRDAVYQNRHRAIHDLAKLREDYYS
jgi:DNA-directed RNA polymerase specialized sigma24 family protein